MKLTIMSVYLRHHWVRAYLVRSPVEVVEEEIEKFERHGWEEPIDG